MKAAPIAMTRGQIPLQGPLEQTCGDGIMTVGGAAGHLCPLSGQGLRYALECGEIAGRVAVDAITEGDVSRAGLSEYERSWKSNFGWEFEACQVLHSSLVVAQDQKMDGILHVLRGNPPLQRSFLNLFMGVKLKKSLKNLLKNDEMVEIIGQGTKDEIMKLI
jgi:flavin-dependent dehydrogenase